MNYKIIFTNNKQNYNIIKIIKYNLKIKLEKI